MLWSYASDNQALMTTKFVFVEDQKGSQNEVEVYKDYRFRTLLDHPNKFTVL